jgi:hypothetical protein
VKQKHLYSLLDSSYTTVLVVFGAAVRLEAPGSPVQEEPLLAGAAPRRNSEILRDRDYRDRTYIYKVPKDAGVKVDDAVVVDSPSNGLTIARVVEVHSAPQIDLDAPFEYKWIVQKIDRTDYDQRIAREREFADKMLEVERVKQRESVLQDMREHLPENSEARRLFDSATQLIEATAEVKTV